MTELQTKMAGSVQGIIAQAVPMLLFLVSTAMSMQGEADQPPCKMIQVANTKYHPAEEGIYFLSHSALCEDSDNWIWSMKERENYIYFSTDPNGWRIGAVKCRSNKAAVYSESDADTPFAIKPGTWKEWDFDKDTWELIDLRLTCVDSSHPLSEEMQRSSASTEGTSVGRVVTYVVIVVVIIGILVMFQRKKKKTHHIL